MSQCNYTPSARIMSMAELNHNKTLNMRLFEHLRSLAVETGDNLLISQAERVKYCSSFWQGQYCPSCRKFHGMHSTGCKHRLCPICATKAARVTAMQAMECIDHIRANHKKLPVKASLLTLTQRNVNGPSLQNEITALLSAWNQLCNQRTFRAQIIGYARTIEIVPSINNDGLYHPHVHAILLHDKNLPPLEWFIARWKSGMKLDYDPICDLRQIEDTQGAVFEVSKYISKMSRVYDGTPLEHDHVRYLNAATYNRRLRTYGGEWRTARTILSQRPVEQMEPDEIDEYGAMTDLSAACPRCGAETVASTLRWAGLQYVTIPQEIRVISMDGKFLDGR